MVFFILAFCGSSLFAQTGKISGQVKDRSTNEPLPGVNVIIEGTNLGAATDEDGFFFIINIPPGVYTLKTQMIGYATYIMENAKVSINRTTTANFMLESETIEGQTVVVEATRPVVQLDVSSSQRIVTDETIQDRPLENFEQILATEAGINLSSSQEGNGLIIRGGGLNETDIVIDGLSTRNERNQQPVTNISLTAIKEVEILTGGFNAEYGEIRSGLINVTTREGSLDRFGINMDYRLSPAARKHYGPSPFDLNGPFWQVYAGQNAFTGVSQDMVDQNQYPFTFVGWNEVSRSLVEDPDPGNDMTPQSLLELWKWQHRTRPYADKPDHIFDATISGPIPKTPVSFLLSQRYEDLQLVYPFSRNNSTTSNTILKLTTYINPQMKLSLNNAYIVLNGISGSIFDDTNGMINGSPEGSIYAQGVISELEYKKMWHDANYSPIESRQYRGGLSLNHVLTPSTYYDLITTCGLNIPIIKLPRSRLGFAIPPRSNLSAEKGLMNSPSVMWEVLSEALPSSLMWSVNL
jgi:outer membrane receptor protein involved in Fe transport